MDNSTSSEWETVDGFVNRIMPTRSWRRFAFRNSFDPEVNSSNVNSIGKRLVLGSLSRLVRRDVIISSWDWKSVRLPFNKLLEILWASSKGRSICDKGGETKGVSLAWLKCWILQSNNVWNNALLSEISRSFPSSIVVII